MLAQAYYNLGRFGRAEVLLHRCTALFEELNDDVMLGRAYSSLALVYLLRGALHHYLIALQTALRHAAAASDRLQTARIQIRMCYGYLCLGMHATAKEVGEAGLASVRLFDTATEMINALMYLALVAADTHQIDHSIAMMDEAHRLAIDSGHRNIMATTSYNMAVIYIAAGRYTDALQIARKLEATDRHTNVAWRLAGDLTLQAEAALGLGQREEAARCSKAAIDEIEQHVREYTHVQEVWMVRSRVLAALGQREEARSARAEARKNLLAQAQEITDPTLHRQFLEDAPLNRAIMSDITFEELLQSDQAVQEQLCAQS
ncbi:MAG: hypothetical protein NVS4B8_01910 [Herpetosiphon sp.]